MALDVILNIVALSLTTLALLPWSDTISMLSNSDSALCKALPCLAIRSLHVFMSSSLDIRSLTVFWSSFLSGCGSSSSSLSVINKIIHYKLNPSSLPIFSYKFHIKQHFQFFSPPEVIFGQF